MTARTVRSVHTKYDGSLHWHHDAMLRLGEDGYGVWLGAPAGAPFQRGDEPPVYAKAACVRLIRPDVWWAATFYAKPNRIEVYCDVATPIKWLGPDEVSAVDLDLDVLRTRAGVVHIVDQDEFAEHRVRFGYPDDVVAAAEAASEELAKLLGERTEPFGSAFRRWLDLVR